MLNRKIWLYLILILMVVGSLASVEALTEQYKTNRCYTNYGCSQDPYDAEWWEAWAICDCSTQAPTQQNYMNTPECRAFAWQNNQWVGVTCASIAKDPNSWTCTAVGALEGPDRDCSVSHPYTTGNCAGETAACTNTCQYQVYYCTNSDCDSLTYDPVTQTLTCSVVSSKTISDLSSTWAEFQADGNYANAQNLAIKFENGATIEMTTDLAKPASVNKNWHVILDDVVLRMNGTSIQGPNSLTMTDSQAICFLPLNQDHDCQITVNGNMTVNGVKDYAFNTDHWAVASINYFKSINVNNGTLNMTAAEINNMNQPHAGDAVLNVGNDLIMLNSRIQTHRGVGYYGPCAYFQAHDSHKKRWNCVGFEDKRCNNNRDCYFYPAHVASTAEDARFGDGSIAINVGNNVFINGASVQGAVPIPTSQTTYAADSEFTYTIDSAHTLNAGGNIYFNGVFIRSFNAKQVSGAKIEAGGRITSSVSKIEMLGPGYIQANATDLRALSIEGKNAPYALKGVGALNAPNGGLLINIPGDDFIGWDGVLEQKGSINALNNVYINLGNMSWAGDNIKQITSTTGNVDFTANQIFNFNGYINAVQGMANIRADFVDGVVRGITARDIWLLNGHMYSLIDRGLNASNNLTVEHNDIDLIGEPGKNTPLNGSSRIWIIDSVLNKNRVGDRRIADINAGRFWMQDASVLWHVDGDIAVADHVYLKDSGIHFYHPQKKQRKLVL